MIDAIGGYFGLELRKGAHYHRDAIRLNTGRNCFEYILRARDYKHVWIPYYTCEVMLEPLNKLHIPYSFYRINEQLEPHTLPELKADDAFLYTNYYGLKQPMVEQLAAHYGHQLIVDNAQAFFAPRIDGVDTFYTARKFFGVSDGAYLYTDKPLNDDWERDYSYHRMSHLLKRIDKSAEDGFSDYQRHEEELCSLPIQYMSHLTARVLESVDYKTVKQKRINNYKILQEALQSMNQLSIELGYAIPMVYPYWTKDIHLRKKLIDNKIFVATYWPNIIDDASLEGLLKQTLLPLPIDQRYGKQDMDRIIALIRK